MSTTTRAYCSRCGETALHYPDTGWEHDLLPGVDHPCFLQPPQVGGGHPTPATTGAPDAELARLREFAAAVNAALAAPERSELRRMARIVVAHGQLTRAGGAS